MKGRQPSTGWMLPLPRGWDLQFPGLSRLMAADEGLWKVLLSLNSLFQVLSKPGSVPAASPSVSSCRSWGSAPYLPGPVALGLHYLYGLLSGLALSLGLKTGIVLRTICGVLWRFLQAQGGIVLSWEVSCLLLSPRLPTGSSVPELAENQEAFPSAFRAPFIFSLRTNICPHINFMKGQEEKSTQEKKSAKCSQLPTPGPFLSEGHSLIGVIDLSPEHGWALCALEGYGRGCYFVLSLNSCFCCQDPSPPGPLLPTDLVCCPRCDHSTLTRAVSRLGLLGRALGDISAHRSCLQSEGCSWIQT